MNSGKLEISKSSIIKFLDSIVSAFLAEVSKIQFDKDNPQQLFLMCLYGRILELAVSIVNLMKANDSAGVPILLRSQIEAFVDFANLVEDEDFIHSMNANFVDQKKRLFENLKKHLDQSEIRSYWKESVEEDGNSIGGKPQNIWKRFKNIRLEKTYVTAYFILCNYAHNNIAMLKDRQLEKDQAGHKVVFFKEEPFSVFFRFAMALGANLVDAHEILIDFFNVSPTSQAQAVCSQFSQLVQDTKGLVANLD